MEDNQSGGNLIFVDGELVPVKIEPKYCINCKQKLPDSLIRRHAIYCSTYCRQEAARKETGTYYVDGKMIAAGVTGAIHELVVCVSLMKIGFYVFRAQSPACPCDLIAMKGEALYKIEVTTGKKSIKTLSFPKKRSGYIFDYIAIVLVDGSIIYKDNNYENTDFPNFI